MNQPGKRTGSNVIGTLGHTFNAISEKPLSSFVSKRLLMLTQRDAGWRLPCHARMLPAVNSTISATKSCLRGKRPVRAVSNGGNQSHDNKFGRANCKGTDRQGK